MKKNTATVLQIITILIGIGVAGFLLWEPNVEGRNVGATLFEVYFTDSFLAFVYLASIPFFIALSHVFKILGYVKQNTLFSQTTINASRIIKHCAVTTIGLTAIGDILISNTDDDRAGGVFISLLITLSAIITAIGAMKVEQRIRKSLERKSKKS